MGKTEQLREIRHEMRGIVSIIANRELTDEEYQSITTVMKKYSKAHHTDLEENQALNIKILEEKLANRK